jgi:hypothetical protein
MTTKSSKKVAQNFSCDVCDYTTCRKINFEKHLLTAKHKKTTNDNAKVAQKVAQHFTCDACDYSTVRKINFEKHLLTAKHILVTKVAQKVAQDILDDASLPNIVARSDSVNQILTATTKVAQKVAEIKYICQHCESPFNDRAGLWRHNKKCLDKDLMLTLITQNTELQKQMIDMMKSGTTNINNNNNSHNKTFNLQLFLNETCKDAMNIMDFVDSIKFQLSDLESVGELGYINGLSNIIIRNLKALDEHLRPVHCSDLKREKIYVKDADKWEKEGADNKILKNAIKYIAHKNVKMIPAFREKYPDCVYSDSRKSDQYNRLIIEAMGGAGNNEDEKSNKIIKKIAKEILIDKGH